MEIYGKIKQKHLLISFINFGNYSDEDAKNYIKIFTLKSEEEISKIISDHDDAPHLRLKSIAEEVTKRVHSDKDLKMAIKASNILIRKSTQRGFKKFR